MTISSTLDQVRVLIGDTDTDNALFPDDQLNWFLSENSDNVYLAAAAACDAVAAKFARAYDFETDGQSFKRSQQAQAFRAMADTFRQRAQGISVVTPTRQDGYSTDVANDAVGTSSSNPRQNFYTVGGVDRLP